MANTTRWNDIHVSVSDVIAVACFATRIITIACYMSVNRQLMKSLLSSTKQESMTSC